MNFHVMNYSITKFDNSLKRVFNKFLKFLNSGDTALKSAALSEVSVFTLILLTQILLTAAMNAATDKSYTIFTE